VIYDATVGGRTRRVEIHAGEGDGRFRVRLDGREVEVDVREAGAHTLSLLVDGRSHEVSLERVEGGYRAGVRGTALDVLLTEGAAATAAPRRTAGGPARVQAPMPGKLVRVLVSAGEEVGAGQGLVVMEAMKMENEIRSPRAGRVKEAPVREGQAVETGALLVLLE
jgi:biotin carboxyl carrier protein